jgi:uncharacterized protein YcbX
MLSLINAQSEAKKGHQSKTFLKASGLSHRRERRFNIEIGRISQLYRYPVKSMAAVRLEKATLGWHGIEGDRRFAFRRTQDKSKRPWLTASRLPELLLYQPSDPVASTDANGKAIHVNTPSGRNLSLHNQELCDELSNKLGSPLALTQLDQGIFDETPVSIINLATISGIAREAGRSLEVLRFRPNILIESVSSDPFAEDAWIGKSLTFGAEENGARVSVTMRDLRCVMINLDPNTAAAAAQVMKAAVRLNDNNAGVYGTVTATGELEVGQKVFLL